MKMIRNLCHKETGGNLYFTFGNSQFLFYFHRFSSKKNKTLQSSFHLSSDDIIWNALATRNKAVLWGTLKVGKINY